MIPGTRVAPAAASNRLPAGRQPGGALLATLVALVALVAPSGAATVFDPTPRHELADGVPDTTRVLPALLDTLIGRLAARDEMAPDSGAAPIRWMWVLRDQLMRPEHYPELVARARAMGVRGLLVQVVGRGDAWYRSDRLPPPEPLGQSGRDPLGELLPLAHDAGLEVHAWVNCCLVWSGDRRPRDPRHVLNAHPEWIARTTGGRALTSFSALQHERMGIEGAFLSPAHPGVREHIAGITAEIARRYPVDGIHLDYIRQPSVDVGFDQTSRARFAMEYGADPGRLGLLPPAQRATIVKLWNDFQRDQVTAIVRAVRDSLDAVRPGILLSAAVFADTVTARRRIQQPWMDWLRDGLIDRAFTMSYATAVQTVLSQLAGYAEELGPVQARIVPGLAVYNAPERSTAAKVKGAVALGFPTLALYSYDSLWKDPSSWPRLAALLAPGDSGALRVGR